ncbi:hypothetical protein M3Y14_34690 (plasmid) [Bacillus thuringiensis]|uniref:hypothetical protein n=1 Tax=Bacillus thuringiensis TaxID=1428 RepID=UPI0022244E80|nr:hypothetical protein [Bacillus thuringiensis]UYX56131.1 hypothetical protein M3Y14_34690 [Bacillus thuringiensis]
MLFSYYFDTKKTHQLNCHFSVLQFNKKTAGVIDIMFSAEISEVMNGKKKKKELKVATFSFTPPSKGEAKHDIDFSRVRYANEGKWIFTITNNKDEAQKVTVGLITATANKNPMGMDIYHDDDFSAELKANTLAILEKNYVPPVLTQTLVNAQFEQPGYPEGFFSVSGMYNSEFQMYDLSDFTQDFAEPIPQHAKFDILLNIAPSEFIKDKNEVFSLEINKLGTLKLLKNGLEYKAHNGSSSEVVFDQYEQEITEKDFFNNGFTTKSFVKLSGDGEGNLIISYNGRTINTTYNSQAEILKMIFKGTLKNLPDGLTDEDLEKEKKNPMNWIKSKVDAIKIVYHK